MIIAEYLTDFISCLNNFTNDIIGPKLADRQTYKRHKF